MYGRYSNKGRFYEERPFQHNLHQEPQDLQGFNHKDSIVPVDSSASLLVCCDKLLSKVESVNIKSHSTS